MKTKQVTIRRDGFHVILAKTFTMTAIALKSEIRVRWDEKNII